MAVVIDNLQIEIQSETTRAVSSLNRLIDTLKDLKAVCSGGAGLGAVVKQLERLNKALNGQGVSDSLGRVSRSAKKATEDVKNYAVALREVSKAQREMSSGNAMTKYNGLNTYSGGAQSRLGGSSIPLLGNSASSPIDVEWKEVEQSGKAVSGLADAMNEVKDTTPFMKTALGEVNQANIDMLKSTLALQSPLGKIANHFANIAKKAKSSGHSVGQLFSSLKRIAMYRLLRTALKAIGDAFSEGLSNAYQYSKIVGTELAPALDHLASINLKMKNQLGALAGQLLIAVMPLLTRLIDFVTKLADRLTEVMAALNGNPTYQKAKDVSTVWEDATTAVKEYKQQLLGLDEINLLNTNNGGNGAVTSPIEDMFEDVPVRDSLKWLGKLKLNFDDVLFNWDDFDPKTKILPGILGLFAGITAFTVTGSALGALTATLAGVALGVLINTVWFDKDKAFNQDEDAWKAQLATIVATVAAGAAGALLGFAVGGAGGAVYGAEIGASLAVLIASIKFAKSSSLKKDSSEAIKEVADVSKRAITKGIQFTPYSNSVNMSVGASVDYRIDKINMKKGTQFEVTGASLITDTVNEAVNSASSSSTTAKPALPQAKTLKTITPVNGSAIGGDKNLAAYDTTLGDFAKSAYGIALGGLAAGGAISAIGGAAAATLSLHKTAAAVGAVGAEMIEFSDLVKKASGFADGGIPSQGTLFYAGEQGPEFVGNLGGSSAVANADQMGEAIEAAVERGMARALSQYGNGSDNYEPMSGDEMFVFLKKKAQRYSDRTGLPAFG